MLGTILKRKRINSVMFVFMIGSYYFGVVLPSSLLKINVQPTWSYLQPASGLRRLSLHLAASAAISDLSVAPR